MSRKTVKSIAIIIIIAMVITSFSFVLFLPGASGAGYVYGATTAQEQKYLNENLKELENYLKLIHDNYKDEVDYKTLMDGAFEGAMYSLGDPYSNFFSSDGDAQDYIESATGEYTGIGVTMKANIEGLCEVTSVQPKGPAQKAGVREGDLIVRVDGQDVTEKSLYDISGLLKGDAGTTVTVTVKRSDSELTFTMIREKIKHVSIEYEMLEGGIGYISLLGFESNGAAEFKAAKATLVKQGAKSLIVDVRDNPGGLVDTAIAIADGFLAKGDITHYREKGKIVETVRAKEKTVEKIPTVLLINENSASASEMLAGALKDNKAATLVGATTYGKGVAQVVGYTGGGSPFTISVFYFLTPNKDEIQHVGVTPDYVVRNSIGEFRLEALNLYQSFAPFVNTSKPGPGETGLNVFAAQQRLLLLGYTPSRNAIMDEATVAAVKAFQREAGLHAYGVLDLTTMRKIDEITLAYISNDSDEDLQLKKAIELLKI